MYISLATPYRCGAFRNARRTQAHEVGITHFHRAPALNEEPLLIEVLSHYTRFLVYLCVCVYIYIIIYIYMFFLLCSVLGISRMIP